MRHYVLLAAIGIAAISPFSSTAFAAPAPEISVEADNLAVRGYDVTAYFQEGRAIRGKAEHQLSYKGATWRFASAENLELFKTNPAVYAPQFGGYCAWAVSQGYIAPGDPEQWKIVDGKLYLNFNERAKKLWEAEQADAIQRGQSNWPSIRIKAINVE